MTLAGMAPSRLRVNSYSLSHVGCVREINEDRCFTNAENGIWAVADGMGGHDGGELASEAIIRELDVMGSPDSADDLDRRFWNSMNRANADILAVSRKRGQGVIGSTVVALLVHGDAFRCLWSGDSRAYLLRGGQLTQMSTDHTEVQDMISRGLISVEEALNYPRRNVILHAIGVHDGVHMDFVDGKVLSGDTFLLCSDGLTGHVSDREIVETMAGGRAREICTQLVDLALARGGTDNVTVSIAQFYAASVTIPGASLMQSAEEIEGSHG
jgi:protein phosphatase